MPIEVRCMVCGGQIGVTDMMFYRDTCSAECFETYYTNPEDNMTANHEGAAIDKSYKERPEPSDDPQYGCNHTESYIDEPHSIVCVSGWMIDVDVYTEGYAEHDFKHPCRNCNPIAFKEFIDERNNS